MELSGAGKNSEKIQGGEFMKRWVKTAGEEEMELLMRAGKRNRSVQRTPWFQIRLQIKLGMVVPVRSKLNNWDGKQICGKTILTHVTMQISAMKMQMDIAAECLLSYLVCRSFKDSL